jgi:hypothetical protein
MREDMRTLGTETSVSTLLLSGSLSPAVEKQSKPLKKGVRFLN